MHPEETKTFIICSSLSLDYYTFSNPHIFKCIYHFSYWGLFSKCSFLPWDPHPLYSTVCDFLVERKWSLSIVSNSLGPRGVYQAALSWNSPGKNTGVSCYFLLQVIFLNPGSNSGSSSDLLHYGQMLYPLSSQGFSNNIWPIQAFMVRKTLSSTSFSHSIYLI